MNPKNKQGKAIISDVVPAGKKPAPAVAKVKPVAKPVSQPKIMSATQPQPVSAPANSKPVTKAPKAKADPSVVFGVIAIVFALLTPLVGAVLAIASIIKGSGSPSNPQLVRLGVIALVLSFVSGVVYLTILDI